MLTRRHTLALLAAAAAPLPVRAASDGMLSYSPGMAESRLAAGETVLLDFWASWCATCAAQDRAIHALCQEKPAYTDAITFIQVDWDEYRTAEVTRRLNIPRRSTLVLLHGEAELGRIVAGTRKSRIGALLDKGLGTDDTAS